MSPTLVAARPSLFKFLPSNAGVQREPLYERRERGHKEKVGQPGDVARTAREILSNSLRASAKPCHIEDATLRVPPYAATDSDRRADASCPASAGSRSLELARWELVGLSSEPRTNISEPPSTTSTATAVTTTAGTPGGLSTGGRNRRVDALDTNGASDEELDVQEMTLNAPTVAKN